MRDTPYVGECLITREFGAVVLQLLDKSTSQPVDPAALLRALRERFPQFREHEQHDAAEVVRLLMDVLERLLGVAAVWEGTADQVVSFSGRESVTATTFATTDLIVPEPGCTLEELLAHAEEPEFLCDYVDRDGAYHALAVKHTAVTRFPRVCVFTFGTNHQLFPVQLPDVWDGRRLGSLVMHQGDDGDGHYLMAARVRDDWWIKSDDECLRVEDAALVTTLAPVCVVYV